MRSHPYSSPSPLPPILDDIAILLPNQSRHSQDDLDMPLYELDPETSHLLPVRKRRRRVRVQGRLALVKSVSTANLRTPLVSGVSSNVSSPATPRFETGVAGSTVLPPRRGRRRSLDDGSCSETEEDDERETAVRDKQLRGYGIGGAGNIRRPTDVIHGPTRPHISLSRLTMMYAPGGSPLANSPDKRWWSLRDLFGRAADRKGKTRDM